MTENIKLLAFDADDTLWPNEPYYRDAQAKMAKILSNYVSQEIIDSHLYGTEMRNLGVFGYGAKSFTLSMIESAIEISEGQIKGSELQQIIQLGKDLIQHPIELLPGVEETISTLVKHYDLMIITKGDLFDQESKIARSNLAHYFKYIEIVSEKNRTVYTGLLDKHQLIPGEFLMVGNSLRSDVLPVIEMGGTGVHVPYHTTWAHEVVSDEAHDNEHITLKKISDLIQLLKK